jgi:hypothetical protein
MNEKTPSATIPKPAFNGLTPSRLNDPARVGHTDDCANCGTSYVVKTKDQKCCCDKCRIEYWHAVKGKLPQRLAALERRVKVLEAGR